MSIDSDSGQLAGVFQAWAARARSCLDIHPDNDTLLDYYDGVLPDHEAENLRDHFALCPECSQRGLDLALFSWPRLVEHGPADQRVGRGGALTHQPLKETASFESSPAIARYESRALFSLPRFLSRPSLGFATAGLCILLSLGLSRQLIEARTELRQPRADVQVLDLQPIGAGAQRQASLSQLAETPAADSPILLILSILDSSSSEYRVDLLDLALPDQGVVWQTDDLRPSSEGYFTLLLPPRLVTDREVRIRLYGKDQEQWSLLAEYAARFGVS